MRVKNIGLLIPICLLCINVNAFDDFESGSRISALSGCGVAISDLWSASHNQAGLAGITEFQIGVSHAKKFSLNELGLSALAVVIPLPQATFCANINYFGFSQYHETKYGMAIARNFGTHFSVGFQFDYFTAYTPEKANDNSAYTFEIGAVYKPINTLSIGFHVFNPIPGHFSETQTSPLYTKAELGCAYFVSDHIMLTGGTKIWLDKHSVFMAALEYSIVKAVTLRTGVATNDERFSFGLGYNVKNANLNVSYTDNAALGYTPMIDLQYLF